MTTARQMLETMELLGRHHEEAASAEEKERFSMALDALGFIFALGQAYGFEDYRQDVAAKGPPVVIAAFDTREEAESWLQNHPEPPHHANILIAGQYFLTAYAPDMNHRAILRDPAFAHYLKEMIQEGLPAPVATFSTLEEANTWLQSQPEPPRQVFVTIAGEYHLAVYHYRIKLRALYPISMAARSAQEGKAADGVDAS
jgi:hypothetical protein